MLKNLTFPSYEQHEHTMEDDPAHHLSTGNSNY